jgi:poly(3-hydroxybutyrate) depolymerase
MQTRVVRNPWFWCGVVGVAMSVWWFVARRDRLRASVFSDLTIDVRAVQRHYRLVVPDTIDRRTPAPLLFAFHGALASVEEAAARMQLDAFAVEKGFYLVYPQGRLRNWPPSIPEDNPEYIEPDLDFFDALCDSLAERYRVDRTRIYVVGTSQGAAFVNLLVAKRSERIAAAASHAGWLPKPLGEQGIHAKRKCPMLFIAGSADTRVPPSAVRAAMTCYEREGHPVQLLVLDGSGHQWSLDRNINERVWRFLSSHALANDLARSE